MLIEMVKDHRERKLRGGVVGAVIGVASMIPMAIDYFQGRSDQKKAEEQEAQRLQRVADHHFTTRLVQQQANLQGQQQLRGEQQSQLQRQAQLAQRAKSQQVVPQRPDPIGLQRLAERDAQQQAQNQRLAFEGDIAKQRLGARGQVMERELQQRLRAVQGFAQAQAPAQPVRRLAQSTRTNPFAMVGRGTQSEMVSILREAYGLTAQQAKKVLAEL